MPRLSKRAFCSASTSSAAAPATALVLAASRLGELLGYALGEGGARPKLARMEYHRGRKLRPMVRHLALE